MGQQGVYFDILDWLDQQRRLDPSAFLLKLQRSYKTGPVIYVDGALAADQLRLHRLVHSHPADAGRTGRLLFEHPLLDQLLRVISALEPIEINLVVPAEPETEPQAPTRSDHTIPAVGYPLLSSAGRYACLLVQAADNAESWPEWRRLNDRDMTSLAGRFHARMVKTAVLPAQVNRRKKNLTRRERETLAWIAAGKSYWEAAIILGITERTVRYFMANARDKLDVVNNAQAVAEAAWQGLIPRLAETPNSEQRNTRHTLS